MLITIAEVAKRLKVSISRVHILIKSGRLKAKKISDHSNAPYLIEEEDLEAVRERKPGRPWPKDHKHSTAYLRRKRRDDKSK